MGSQEKELTRAREIAGRRRTLQAHSGGAAIQEMLRGMFHAGQPENRAKTDFLALSAITNLFQSE